MTTSAVVYALFFIHIGVILVVAAYYTLGASLAPRLTDRARTRFASRPWLPVLLGVLVSVPWVALAIVLLNASSGPLRFLGASLAALWVLMGLLGGAGIAQHIGRVEGEAVKWTHAFRGGLLMVLTWALPIVGWLIMLPLSLAAGIGCLLMGLVPVRSSQASIPVVAPSSAITQ